jgi:hypothetical protein
MTTTPTQCMYTRKVDWVKNRELRSYPEPNNSLNIAVAKLRLELGIEASVFPSHHCGHENDTVCGYESVDIGPLCSCHPSVLKDRIYVTATKKSHSHVDMDINTREAFNRAYLQAYESTKDERFLKLIQLTVQFIPDVTK